MTCYFLVHVTKTTQISNDGTVNHFPEPKNQGENSNRFQNGHLPQELRPENSGPKGQITHSTPV